MRTSGMLALQSEVAKYTFLIVFENSKIYDFEEKLIYIHLFFGS